jgi:hypothetical protein
MVYTFENTESVTMLVVRAGIWRVRKIIFLCFFFLHGRENFSNKIPVIQQLHPIEGFY